MRIWRTYFRRWARCGNMPASIAAIVRWAESQLIVTKMLFWCSMALTFLCELAATTIISAISMNKIQDDSEDWMAVWFFAVIGGAIWIVGRTGGVERDHATASRFGGNF
jgi:hypothetical protein